MTQLHGPDQGKLQFLMDSNDLARVVGTAVGAALAQLEDPLAEQRHQQLLDAVHGRDSCGGAVGECADTGAELHLQPNTSYDVRWHPVDENRRMHLTEGGVMRGGVRYPEQDAVPEPEPEQG